MPSQQASYLFGAGRSGSMGVTSFAGQVSSGGIPTSTSTGGPAGTSSLVSSIFYLLTLKY